MASEMLEKMRAFMNSPEGKASAERMRAKMQRESDRKQRAFEYIESLSREEFEAKLAKEIARHDDDYERRCYAKGYMPHPRNLMYFVFSSAELGGRPYNKQLDSFDANFGGGTIKYRSHYFKWIFGQGTVLRIFNPKKECIFSL